MTDASVNDWIGRTRQSRDLIAPFQAAGMAAMLDYESGPGDAGDLPPGWHWMYFADTARQSALGTDGHESRGEFPPPIDLPRRMWAGGALQFHTALRAGQMAEKVSRVVDVTRKDGRSGPLGFVTLAHEIWQGGQLCVTERQDLVYREDPDPSAPRPLPPEAPTGEEASREIGFTETLLFRYSALTFNGHRIHYDVEYARAVEGYGGLVVHGPLLAQALLLFAQEHAPVRGFSFRATAPLMHDERATLCRDGTEMWVRAPDGRQCMRASVEY